MLAQENPDRLLVSGFHAELGGMHETQYLLESGFSTRYLESERRAGETAGAPFPP
jgi:hypothetical protein